MQVKNTIDDIEFLAPVVVYALLTWLWFDLNNSNALPIIGHTDLVRGWCNGNADKFKLLIDLIYFAISVTAMAVATEVIVSKIELPFFGFKKDCGVGAAFGVNLVVFLYEFHVLEFRLKLIGLSIALIILFFVAMAIYMKVMEYLRPILKITDAVETIGDITNATNTDTSDRDDKK